MVYKKRYANQLIHMTIYNFREKRVKHYKKYNTIEGDTRKCEK